MPSRRAEGVARVEECPGRRGENRRPALTAAELCRRARRPNADRAARRSDEQRADDRLRDDRVAPGRHAEKGELAGRRHHRRRDLAARTEALRLVGHQAQRQVRADFRRRVDAPADPRGRHRLNLNVDALAIVAERELDRHRLTRLARRGVVPRRIDSQRAVAARRGSRETAGQQPRCRIHDERRIASIGHGAASGFGLGDPLGRQAGERDDVSGRRNGPLHRRHRDEVPAGRQPGETVHAPIVGSGRRSSGELRLAGDERTAQQHHRRAGDRLAGFVGDRAVDRRLTPEPDRRVGAPLAVGERQRARRITARGASAERAVGLVARLATGEDVAIRRRQIGEDESAARVGRLPPRRSDDVAHQNREAGDRAGNRTSGFRVDDDAADRAGARAERRNHGCWRPRGRLLGGCLRRAGGERRDAHHDGRCDRERQTSVTHSFDPGQQTRDESRATLAPHASPRARSGGVPARRSSPRRPAATPRRSRRRSERRSSTTADVRLSYQLDTPSGRPPFPAVVIGHGSGETRKEACRWLANRMLQRGYATLCYDKRGVGESTGTYVNIGITGSEERFALLASDMEAGVRFLRAPLRHRRRACRPDRATARPAGSFRSPPDASTRRS